MTNAISVKSILIILSCNSKNNYSKNLKFLPNINDSRIQSRLRFQKDLIIFERNIKLKTLEIICFFKSCFSHQVLNHILIQIQIDNDKRLADWCVPFVIWDTLYFSVEKIPSFRHVTRPFWCIDLCDSRERHVCVTFIAIWRIILKKPMRPQHNS